MKFICQNETCQNEFEVQYEGQQYCDFKCKRARVMRKNRAKKNEAKVVSRAGDTKICQYCKDTINRNPRMSDYHWEKTVYHQGCQKKANFPGNKL